MEPKINTQKLTETQRQQLETYQQAQKQLQLLEDIASMVQDVASQLNDSRTGGKKTTGELGALLVDIRENLSALKDKEAPELPDYAKPVVDAVSQLETRLTAALKAIDVKPTVKVDAPQVNVSPSTVDLKGVEKAVTGLATSFQAAIKLIDIPEAPKTDFQPLLDAWEGISEQLVSIENATRMKPLPGSTHAQAYGQRTDGSWGQTPLPLLDLPWDSFTGSNPDANGYNQTLTYKNGATTVRTLSLTYDASGNVTAIARN